MGENLKGLAYGCKKLVLMSYYIPIITYKGNFKDIEEDEKIQKGEQFFLMACEKKYLI